MRGNNMNFGYFSMKYLNHWLSEDSNIFTSLNSFDKEERREALRRGAYSYKVIRTLKNIDERHRLGKALDSLEKSLEGFEGDDKPEALGAVHYGLMASLSRKGYGSNLISAASKLLWMRYRWPFIIYDSRANRCLTRLCSEHGMQSYDIDSYSEYVYAWRSCFAIYQKDIAASCKELNSVKAFSLASNLSKADINDLTSSVWFQDRVFDMFLWQNGGSDNGEKDEISDVYPE